MSSRLDRINALLQRELAGILQRDFEFKNHIVTVTAVAVTQDTKEGKVYLSILGKYPTDVLQRITRKKALIQAEIAKKISLRNTPVLRFVIDESAVKGMAVEQILDDIEILSEEDYASSND